MFHFKSFSSFAAWSFLFPCAVNAAVVSLFIPDTNPAAITADILGTDAAGRTTWRLAPGQPSGTLSPPLTPVTATMVAGAQDVHVVEYVPDFGATFYDDCAVKDGTAVCTVVLSSVGGATTVGVRTESVGALEVQIGTPPPAGTAAPAKTGTASGSSVASGDNQDGPSALHTGSAGNGAAGRAWGRVGHGAVAGVVGAVVMAVSLF